MKIVGYDIRQVLTSFIILAIFILTLKEYIPIVNAILFAPFIALLWAISENNFRKTWLTSCMLIIAILIGFFIAIFRPDGFNYPLVWQDYELYEGGKEFYLYANISKGLGGCLVIIWLIRNYCLNKNKSIQTVSPLKIGLTVVIGVFIVILTAVFVGLQWQVKVSDGTLYFIGVNLFITVLSEEAFFRLLIQKPIMLLSRNETAGIIFGVVISTILFTISHSIAVGPLLLVYVVAGLVYALTYVFTRSLLASILVHFGVNLCHFIFLEYPV